MTCLERVTGLSSLTVPLWPLSSSDSAALVFLLRLCSSWSVRSDLTDHPVLRKGKPEEATQQFCKSHLLFLNQHIQNSRTDFGSVIQGISHFNMLMHGSPFTGKRTRTCWQKGTGFSRLLLMGSHQFPMTLMLGELMQRLPAPVLLLRTFSSLLLGKILLS